MPKLGPKTHINTQGGADEANLLSQLNSYWKEGKRAREVHHTDAMVKESVALFRGEVHLSDEDEELFFKANIIQAFLGRQVSQLTDNRPIFRHEPTRWEMERPAKIINQVFTALWDEATMQRQLYKMVHNAGIKASAGLKVSWDPMKDDLSVELIMPDQIAVHPGVREAARFDDAEYIVVRRPVPLDLIAAQFGVRGGFVKSNVKLTGNQSAGSGSVIDGADEAFNLGAHKKLSTGDTIPHAWIYEAWVQDRQMTMDQKTRLFPGRRRVVFAEDIILWDGPTPNWHGLPDIEWFDWTVDPDHLWGISEPQNLKHMQLAFNDIMNGTVANAIDINTTTVSGEAEALESAEWLKLTNTPRMRVVKHAKNKTLTVITPPPYGASQVAMSRFIFQMMQLMTGVTDVTLGESPGSLQSGIAIEGLQESANLMTRDRQSRLEDFMKRIGHKITTLILQHMDADRIFAVTGPVAEATPYLALRQTFFTDTEDATKQISPERRKERIRFTKFNIVPGSSAPGAKQRRAELMFKMLKTGAASRQDVLEAADYTPEMAKKQIERATEDFGKNPLMQAEANKGKASKEE